MNKMEPLLYQACKNKVFGEVFDYEGGAIYEAGFIYLEGKVNPELLKQIKERWKYRMFICLSEEWKKALVSEYKEILSVTRYQMILDMNSIDEERLKQYLDKVPNEYTLASFEEKEYEQKPFNHGTMYKNYEDFKKHGAGAVIWYKDEIVSSASSFISYNNDVELDISTAEEHRRKSLGLICAAKMLLDCKFRGVNVHWDAQNVASKQLAERLGYTLDHEYEVYCFVAPPEI